MSALPPIHIVSVVHLCFVAAFLALYMCEAVVEGSHSKDKLHPIAIRMHYLLDVFVEIPLMIGIFVSGLILSLLVDDLTALHLWLIACGTVVVLGCLFSFFKYVRSRKRLISQATIDHGMLVRIRRRFSLFTFSVINPALIAALIIGFWLAQQRMLEAFK